MRAMLCRVVVVLGTMALVGGMSLADSEWPSKSAESMRHLYMPLADEDESPTVQEKRHWVAPMPKADEPPAEPKCAIPPVPRMPAAEPDDPPAPHVTLKTRVLACADASQELQYRIMIENCGEGAAHHVLVRNPLPANARFVRATPEPSHKDAELQWQLGTLPPGARRDIVLVLLPTGGEDVTSCARVQFEHGQCVTTRLVGTVPPSPPPPLVTTGKLTLAISGPKQQYFNLPAEYFLKVTNNGTATATKVLLTAILPDAVEFARAGQGGQHVGKQGEVPAQVAWYIDKLEPGASRTVELVVKARTAGEICIRASAIADPKLSAQAEACTTFIAGESGLSLETIDRLDPVGVGGQTSYPIVVMNTGGGSATNIVLKAEVPLEMEVARVIGPVDHKVQATPNGQVVLFAALASLPPGGRAEFEVFVRCLRPGDVRFRVEMTADQLTRGLPVIEEESTRIYDQ